MANYFMISSPVNIFYYMFATTLFHIDTYILRYLKVKWFW